MQGIYFIKNIINNKLYIGSSIDIELRLHTHFKNLENNKHSNKYLQKAYNKYSKINFISGILEVTENIERNDLFNLEFKYINNYNKKELYNLNFKNQYSISESLCKETFILDLQGNVLKYFESIKEASEYLNSKYQINTTNTSAIILNKYRVVTKDFYEKELNLILSWRNYKVKNEIYKSYYKYDNLLNKWIVKYKDELIGIFEEEDNAIKISKHLMGLINKNQF